MAEPKKGRDPSAPFRQRAQLRLPELAEEPGPYILNWIGDLSHRRRQKSVAYDITAQFYRVGSDGETKEVAVPLEAMHWLRLGSEWRYGVMTGERRVSRATVVLDLPRLDLQNEHQALPPAKLVPSFSHPLHGMQRPGYCRILPVANGPDLVIPIAEIARTWYLFHPAVVAAAIGDGIRTPRAMSRRHLPWDPDETKIVQGFAHVTYRFEMGEHAMKRLARLLFDAHGLQRSHHFANAFRQQSQDDRFSLPFTSIPMEGQPILTVRYVDLPAWHEKKRPMRRLVLSVDGVDHPPPWRDMSVAPLVDTRPDIEGDPNRPIVRPYGSAIILPDDGGLALHGDAGDTSLHGAWADMLPFKDSAFDLPVRLMPRKPSTHQSGGAPLPPVRVDGLGADQTGRPTEGTASLNGEEAAPSEQEKATPDAPPVALLTMRAVFGLAIDTLRRSLTDGQAGYLNVGGPDEGLLHVVHEDGKTNHTFLILHAARPGKNVYVLRAAGEDGEDSHQVLVCRQPSHRPLTLAQFSSWLAGFPYPGRPAWIDKRPDGLPLNPKGLNHQPRKEPFDEDAWNRRFAERIVMAVLALIE